MSGRLVGNRVCVYVCVSIFSKKSREICEILVMCLFYLELVAQSGLVLVLNRLN